MSGARLRQSLSVGQESRPVRASDRAGASLEAFIRTGRPAYPFVKDHARLSRCRDSHCDHAGGSARRRCRNECRSAAGIESCPDGSRPGDRLSLQRTRQLADLSTRHPGVPRSRRTITAAAGLYEEFLDTSRFPRAEYGAGYRQWLIEKYASRTVDLVVASGQEAVEFLAGGNPWPGVPVLYSDVGPLDDRCTPEPARRGRADLRGSLPPCAQGDQDGAAGHGARGLHSRRVARWTVAVSWICGAGARGRTRPRAVDLNGLAMDDLLQRVANMPEHTVLFLFSSQVDVVGRSFQPMRACELSPPRRTGRCSRCSATSSGAV